MFLEQDVGKNHNTKKGNRSFESIDKFKYLKKKKYKLLARKTKQQTEFRKCILPFDPESFFFSFCYQIFKFKVYRTIILPVVLYGCEICSRALRKEHRPRLRVPENKM